MSWLYEWMWGEFDNTIASQETIQQRNLLLKQIRETKQFKLNSVDKDVKKVSFQTTKPIIIPKRKKHKNRKKHTKRSTYEF